MKNSTLLALIALPLLLNAPLYGQAQGSTLTPFALSISEPTRLPFVPELESRIAFSVVHTTTPGSGHSASVGGVDDPGSETREWSFALKVQRKPEAGGAQLAIHIEPDPRDKRGASDFQVMVDKAGLIMNLDPSAPGQRPWDELAFALGSGLHARPLESGMDYTIAIHRKSSLGSLLSNAHLQLEEKQAKGDSKLLTFGIRKARSKANAKGTATYRVQDGMLQTLEFTETRTTGDDTVEFIRITRQN